MSRCAFRCRVNEKNTDKRKNFFIELIFELYDKHHTESQAKIYSHEELWPGTIIDNKAAAIRMISVDVNFLNMRIIVFQKVSDLKGKDHHLKEI